MDKDILCSPSGRGNDAIQGDTGLKNNHNRSEDKTISPQRKTSDEIKDLERFIDQMSAKDETNAIRLYERMALELKAEVSFLRKLNQATLFQDVSMNQASNSILRDEIMYLRRELQTKNNFIKLLVSSGNKEVQNHSANSTSSTLRHIPVGAENKTVHSSNTYESNGDGNDIITNRKIKNRGKNNTDEKISKRKVEVIGDFMLNNIQVRELSKLYDVRISYFSGCMTPDLLNHIKPSLPRKPNKIIIHVGTNDLISDDNMLNNVKKITELVKEETPATKLAFSSIIIRKDREDLFERIKIINSHLLQYCNQHDVGFIDNSNIAESCLDISNVHLNRKGNSLLAKNFLNHITNGE